MKQIYIALALLISTFSFGQIPEGYYNTATGTGYTLKTQLKSIINDTNDGLTNEYVSIDNGYGELYTIYATSDIDSYYENNGTVLDMYSENPNGPDAYEYTYEIEDPDDRDSGFGGTSEGEFYNREHIIPQSVFNSNSPMRNDAYFVVPSDKYVNAQRGNLPFGVVQSANYTSSNGSKRGNNLNAGYSAGYSDTVFEPIDEFKGDIARMFFYFATRYEDNITSFDAYDMFDGTSNQVFNTTFFNILYQWHTQDPVSQRELDRNDAIFAAQNNRNPFIDHPEYVQNIWSNLLSLESLFDNTFKIYPNPVKNQLHISINNGFETTVEIYNVLGRKMLNQTIQNSQVLSTEHLSNGVYILKLTQRDQSTTKKLIKN